MIWPMIEVKKVTKSIVRRRLYIPAGGAKPTPPVGPALSELKVNTRGFCEEFNAATKGMSGILPTDVFVSAGGKYSFTVKKETATELIKRKFGIKSGSKSPKRETILEIQFEELRSIAQEKMEDLTAFSEDAAMKILSGAAESIGIKINH